MKIFLLCILCLCVGLLSGVMIGIHKGKQTTRQYRGSKKRPGAAYRVRMKKKRSGSVKKDLKTVPSDEVLKEWAEKGLKTH